MLDGFQNEAYLKMADRVLKEFSKVVANETFKVSIDVFNILACILKITYIYLLFVTFWAI